MSENAEKIPAKIGEFKGNAVITLPIGNSERYSFTFGVSKAKAILEYLDDIKKFVEEHEKKPEATE